MFTTFRDEISDLLKKFSTGRANKNNGLKKSPSFEGITKNIINEKHRHHYGWVFQRIQNLTKQR